MITQERAEHILLGTRPNSGGHLHPSARGKASFPAHWDPPYIIDHIVDIARDSDLKWRQLTGPINGITTAKGKPARAKVDGIREKVSIRVIAEIFAGGQGIITAFPRGQSQDREDTSERYAQLDIELLTVADELTDNFPVEAISDFRDFIENNEVDVGLEILLTQIYEYNTVLSQRAYKILEKAGRGCIDDSYFDGIKYKEE